MSTSKIFIASQSMVIMHERSSQKIKFIFERYLVERKIKITELENLDFMMPTLNFWNNWIGELRLHLCQHQHFWLFKHNDHPKGLLDTY